MIPEAVLTGFVGEVENLLKIDTKNVFLENYRIDVWTTVTSDGIVPSNKIQKSYFATFDGSTIVDRTLTRKNS